MSGCRVARLLAARHPRVHDGFIAEPTYGPEVNWYRNIVAAGECVIISRRSEYEIDRIEPYPADAGIRAFGYPAAFVLKLLRRHEFRFLHVADDRPAGGSGR